MSRIKGRYVAQVVLEWDVPREANTFPLEKIRDTVCGGNMTAAIKRILTNGIDDDVSLTVDQQFADVYEVEGGQDDNT